jgi:hypothetical protein
MPNTAHAYEHVEGIYLLEITPSDTRSYRTRSYEGAVWFFRGAFLVGPVIVYAITKTYWLRAPRLTSALLLVFDGGAHDQPRPVRLAAQASS